MFVVIVLPFFAAGCSTVYYPDASSTLAGQHGIYHEVKSPETLWGIDQVAREDKRDNVGKYDPHTKEFEWPLRAKISGYFEGNDKDFWNKGIKIQTVPGNLVRASRAGKIVFVGDLTGYGSTVIIDHKDDFMSVYAHNGSCKVSVGDVVSKGDAVAGAASGSGKFLYFEIRRRGEAVNPLFYLPKI